MQRALDLIGDTVAALDAIAAVGSAARATAGKVGALLRGLETYVAGQAAMIVDYAAARHDAEPISTAPTESTVQWLLYRRMGARQADALVATGSAHDVEGSNRCRERHLRTRLCSR